MNIINAIQGNRRGAELRRGRREPELKDTLFSVPITPVTAHCRSPLRSQRPLRLCSSLGFFQNAGARMIALLRPLALVILGYLLPLFAGEAAAEPAAYRLFPGDLVRVLVLGEPDLTLDMRVPASGTVPYPLVGPLPAPTDRTCEDLRADLTKRLADGYLRNPQVTVSLVEYGARTAWVVGAVMKPGMIRLDPLRPTTAMQALGEAGGLGEDADRANARVLRETGNGVKQSLELPAALLPEQDLVLHHGDVIVIPRRDRVYVLGQVAHPGAVPLPSREVLTVSRAIAIVGGFDRFARETKVHLLRAGSDPIVLDVRAVLDGTKDAQDPALKAGDTIFVPESRF